MSAPGCVTVSKLDQQTYTSVFESHRVPHLFGLVPHQSIGLGELLHLPSSSHNRFTARCCLMSSTGHSFKETGALPFCRKDANRHTLGFSNMVRGKSLLRNGLRARLWLQVFEYWSVYISPCAYVKYVGKTCSFNFRRSDGLDIKRKMISGSRAGTSQRIGDLSDQSK